MSTKTRVSEVSNTAKELPKVQTEGRLEHALELFKKGSRTFSSLETDEDLRPAILNLVEQRLPREYQHQAFEIARAVITEANHHKMDPFFLLAVIQTESQFNSKARGSHGEIGLMQILPSTAKWLAAQAGISRSQINLEDPSVNIRIGATYFSLLRKSFDGQGNRYVAAYNMGVTNVRRLLASNTEPYIYPGRVLSNYRGYYKILDHTVPRNIASVD